MTRSIDDNPDYLEAYNKTREIWLKGMALCDAINEAAPKGIGEFDKISWLLDKGLDSNSSNTPYLFPMQGVVFRVAEKAKESFDEPYLKDNEMNILAQGRIILGTRLELLKIVTLKLGLNVEKIIQESRETIKTQKAFSLN